MRHYHRLITIAILLFSGSAHALEFFLDGIYWRATETNDWVYINSETLPNQTITYKTINFDYSPGFMIGARYVGTWDAMVAYTKFYDSANDSATGHLQPSFSGSVTAKPSHAYLYQSGTVNQSINYNIFDLVVGRRFYPIEALMLHPIAGFMGGWIDQSIHAQYQGPTSADEQIKNNFSGIGPKAGIEASVRLFNYQCYQPALVAAFAASYLLGHWNIKDVTVRNPPNTYFIQGTNHSMGALTLQSSIGIQLQHKNFAVKLAYDISDWFNQTQYFDNDTGAHNNDLILQGILLGVTYST